MMGGENMKVLLAVGGMAVGAAAGML